MELKQFIKSSLGFIIAKKHHISKIGKNVYAQTVKGFNACEMHCPRENVGQIKIIRTIPDIRLNTCKVVISVRSESADTVKVRMLDYGEVKKSISDSYGIDV